MSWRRLVIKTLLQTHYGSRILERILEVRKALDYSLPNRAEIRLALTEFIELIETNGFSLERFGDKHDGGYLLSSEFLALSDIVISCGVGTNDSFEISILPFVREIHMIDHTVNYEPTSPKVIFHKKKLVGRVRNSSSEISLPELMFNLDNTYVVKLDIEGSEWDILDNLDTEYLNSITQLVVEFHGILDLTKNGNLNKVNRILEKINKYFLVTNFHPNNCGRFEIFLNVPVPDVIEITYLNKRIAKQFPLEHKRRKCDNFPNNPAIPDITLWKP